MSEHSAKAQRRTVNKPLRQCEVQGPQGQGGTTRSTSYVAGAILFRHSSQGMRSE